MCIRDRFGIDLDGNAVIGNPLIPINADLYLQDDLYALKGATDQDAVLIQNSVGVSFNDASNANWDAVSALKQADGTFRVLLDGTGSLENQGYVWTTDDQGLIISGNGGWKSGAELYVIEDEFSINLDDDPIIGNPLKLLSADLYLQNDLYALKGPTDTDAVVLTNNSGKTYNDATAANWDAVSAIQQTDGTFRVLLDGENVRENQAYVWTTNAQGVITSGNGGRHCPK